MNIIFFGTSDFAIPSLRAIEDSSHKILAVFTQPDRKKGRSLKISAAPIKTKALRLGLTIHQSHDLSEEAVVKLLLDYKAELFVVVSYGIIFDKKILSIPSRYCINLHASLLPKYRGAAPINWAIINGEEKSGVTIMKMNEYMDRGDIIVTKEEAIYGEDDALSLSKRLSETGAPLLLECIDLIEIDKAKFTKQDEDKATYAPKLEKKDGLINWSSPALQIHNRVRGMIPWPGAFTYLDKKLIKILKTEVAGLTTKELPGKIVAVDKKGLVVAAGFDSALRILQLQPQGKNPMDINSFVNGHKISIGQPLG